MARPVSVRTRLVSELKQSLPPECILYTLKEAMAILMITDLRTMKALVKKGEEDGGIGAVRMGQQFNSPIAISLKNIQDYLTRHDTKKRENRIKKPPKKVGAPLRNYWKDRKKKEGKTKSGKTIPPEED